MKTWSYLEFTDLIESKTILGEAWEGALALETDSRKSLKDKIFVALEGENFDGHDFVQQAADSGARGILVHKKNDSLYKELKASICIIQVPNTLETLQTMARNYRKKNKFWMAAISGSQGKTSAREFCFQMLEFCGVKAFRSPKSFNNHLGLPLTILMADADTEALVLEMGMNHLGELKALSQIAEPDMVGLTCVGRSHLGPMGGYENVLLGKAEIYEAAPGKTHLYNLDQPDILDMQKNWGSHASAQFSFSNHNSEADVFFKVIEETDRSFFIKGHILDYPFKKTEVPLSGAFHAQNLALGALIAVKSPYQIEPAKILESFIELRAPKGRTQWVENSDGFKVFFDAYNANPDSMEAFLRSLESMAGDKILILGEMLELGKESEVLHQELFRRLSDLKLKQIVYIGSNHLHFKESYMGGAPFLTHHEVNQELAQQVYAFLAKGDLVALKASRGIKLDQFLQYWNIQTDVF